MTNPLQDIEDRVAHTDLGRMMYRLYLGAREEGATRLDALFTVAGIWLGISLYNKEVEEGGETT